MLDVEEKDNYYDNMLAFNPSAAEQVLIHINDYLQDILNYSWEFLLHQHIYNLIDVRYIM